MLDDYRSLVIFDDIAFAALKVSLSDPERSIVMDRLRQDWMTDVGAIGILRREHIVSASIEAPARLYWESRRERLSARVESLLAALLMNLASSAVYDVLKEFVTANYNIADLLQVRGTDLQSIIGFSGDIRSFIEHVRICLRLYRAKQEVSRVDEVRSIVEGVLEGKKLFVEASDSDLAFELFVANLMPAVRGIVKNELEKHLIHVDDEAEGVLTRGLAASPGYGYGRPFQWKKEQMLPDEKTYVLLIGNDENIEAGDVIRSLEQSAAVISWNGGMTSHIAVACRGVGCPAVIVTARQVEMLIRKSFLIVNGGAGEVRSYHGHPEILGAFGNAPRTRQKRLSERGRSRAKRI